MSQIRQLSCVAALLMIGLAGCVTDGNKTPHETAGKDRSNLPPDRKVPGERDKVSDLMKASLAEVNIIYSSVREGEGIRFECRTASNKRFCLILVNATMKKDDPRTRIHVGWEYDRQPEDGLTDPVVNDILNRVAMKAEEEKRRKDAEEERHRNGIYP
jgi:hypothetical protein